MNNQFNVLVSAKDLANAARFLQSCGNQPRSRNNLVVLSIQYLSELAEQQGLTVATSELEGIEFLVANNLAGSVGKAAVKVFSEKVNKNFTGFDSIAQLVAKNVKERKNSFKDDKDSLFLFCQSVASEKGEAGFSEAMKLLASSKFAEDEEFREKVTKLFNKEE